MRDPDVGRGAEETLWIRHVLLRRMTNPMGENLIGFSDIIHRV